jgi:hypothetical protein
MHVDELFELSAAVDDTVMRSEDGFKEFRDGPRDYVL